MSETPGYANALPLNSMLHEYRLEAVLGAGGFGMTYLGWDTYLEKHVAIKEYLPSKLTVRALDGSVVPVDSTDEFGYQWGLERFIQEARTLARFSHPNIVRVNRFFQANGTSYMVMDHEAGTSVHQYLRRVARPDESTLKAILMPILDGLKAVHIAGFLHRDIKPSNVFLRDNGTPVLLDFGSAQMVGESMSKTKMTIVTPGYAPLEQYRSTGRQGPWSDIYALAGVMYRGIAGSNPPNPSERLRNDEVGSVLALARHSYSERFLKAVEWAMAIEAQLRPQDVTEWREVLLGRATPTALSHAGVHGSDAHVASFWPLGADERQTRGRAAPHSVKPHPWWRTLRGWVISATVVALVTAALYVLGLRGWL